MTTAVSDIGPHLLGRHESTPDERDDQHLAADRLRQVKALKADVPFNDALLHTTIANAYKKGYFRTAAETAAFFRWLKAKEQPPTPVKPSPKPSPSPAPTPAPTGLRRKRWNLGTILDQGQTEHCIGYGGAHYGICEPMVDAWTAKDAEALYYACKVIDGEPKAEDGSSVRSLAQELKSLGRINEYVWCAKVDETGSQQSESVVDWLLNQGPVVFGTAWYNDMFTPNAQGLISVSGADEGGHCYLGVGVDLDTGLLECANSWSVKWGVQGHFFVPIKSMQKLLDQEGEALAALELPLAA